MSDKNLRVLLRLLQVARSRGVIVLGASPKPARESYGVLRSLKEVHRIPHLAAVNPAAGQDEILGVPCFTDLKTLRQGGGRKEADERLICVFRSDPGPGVREAVSLGFRHFWLQYGVFLSADDKKELARERERVAPEQDSELLIVEDSCLKVELGNHPAAGAAEGKL
eukprot:g2109.t1